LNEPEETEARFLLVEVFQEQGRWLESLDMLNLLEQRGTSGRGEEQLVYLIMGRANLGASPAQDMLRHIPRLIDVARNAGRVSVRARAARALAYLVGSLGDKVVARRLIEVVASVPTEDLDEDSRGILTLAKGLIHFHAGLTSESLAEVRAGIEILRSLGAANVVMAQLHIGVGAIHSRNGAYEEALAASEHAFNIAVRLGNDSLILSLIGNIVMYCSRLGRYEDVSRWLTLIPRGRTPEFAGLMDLQISYHTALNEVIHGRNARADEAVAALEHRMRGDIPPWMHQLWQLSKADLLWISNRRSEAIRVALQEIRDSAGEIHSPTFAGAFARWVAVTYGTVGEPKNASMILEGLVRNLDSFDALDQVEILCSMRYAGLNSECHAASLEAQLQTRLSRLPKGVAIHLKRLEILP
jgi:hypothetical protein